MKPKRGKRENNSIYYNPKEFRWRDKYRNKNQEIPKKITAKKANKKNKNKKTKLITIFLGYLVIITLIGWIVGLLLKG
ncbi:hypothetical protein MKFW12EY_22520 [Methylomonas koyamae]|nr:hypothetical protein MKFW12EY_22520 [Methylomonas koyamae]